MKLNPRERFIAIIAGTVVLLLLLDQVLLSPLFERLDEADTVLAEQEAKLQAASELFQSDLAARRRWKELAGAGLKTDASAAEGLLLARVRDAAQSAGLNLQSLKPERSDRVSGLGRITLRVTATGSMSRVGRFLHDLGQSRVPLRFNDLQITSRKDGTDDLAINLGIATIFEPEQEARR